MKSKKFWNDHATQYDTGVMKRYSEAYRRTIELAKTSLKPEDRVFDFGCGTGLVTNEIAGSVGTILAVDLSEKMLEIAKHKAAERGITNVVFEACGSDTLPASNDPFDVVCAFNVLYFIRDLDGLLARFHAMLKPGGMFLSVTDCVGRPKDFKTRVIYLLVKLGVFPFMRFMSTQDLVASVEKAGFEVLHKENLFTDPPNYYVAAKKK